MLDFLVISTRRVKRDKSTCVEVYPNFRLYPKSLDLMIRGGDFYAAWLDDKGLWTTNEQEVLKVIDTLLDEYVEANIEDLGDNYRVLYMWDSQSGMIDSWHKYCQKQMRDCYSMLDEELIFDNTPVTRESYASKRLPYPLVEGPITGYDTIMSVIYSPEERHKLEWAIGAIVSGDAKWIQKFMVLYGSAGTGKSTFLNIVQKLFEGYYTVFDAKALGSSNNSFALEAFKTNPLVAIQHDGDLSKIEDNTRLNSLVSHELMTVNEKFKSTYANQFKCFLFMGTNKPVKITDGKSGLIRRLIDVSPTGDKLSPTDYKRAFKQIDFELGAIAYHCLQVYRANPDAYDNYIPITMMGASNDFYNFVIDSYHIFLRDDGTTLKAAWEMYRTYCEEANVPYPFSQRNFKEELKNYFRDFKERVVIEDGTRLRSYYSGFRTEKFGTDMENPQVEYVKQEEVIESPFQEQKSIFDIEYASCSAQYGVDYDMTGNQVPGKKWTNVSTTLGELDTSLVHFVMLPRDFTAKDGTLYSTHIIIDFDMRDENGNKSFELNWKEASKWPATYSELSKSGGGIHLHYIYDGDPSKLSMVFAPNVEIKVFKGNGALRRRLTKCINNPIAHINSGLPLKGDDKMITFEGLKNERALRTVIIRNLNKEYHPATKPSIDFIYKTLEDAYNSGMKYDVSDMKNAIYAFAACSTNQSKYCIDLVGKMKFKSEEPAQSVDNANDDKIVFYDIEVFPNLFLVNWKVQGKGNPVIRMINPSSSDIEDLIAKKLVGFNCRRYDNHILYARLLGKSNEELYDLSQRIVSGERNCFFGDAYNLSYTDIYDFASAGNKKSLKKLEIEMGIHHQELGLPWDKPVPEALWEKVAEYCDNDVIATEAAFEYLSADWTARQILADITGLSVNDTTNTLTTKFVFGSNKKPQGEFCYRDLSKPVHDLDPEVANFLEETCPEMMAKRHNPEHDDVPFNMDSLLPYFPGYKYERGISTYRGEEVGEGGYVYAEPGMYTDVALLDIASMHPHSTIAECLFGPKYTRLFRDIVEGRVSIKHEDWPTVNSMFDGKLTPYVEKVQRGEMTSKDLANALKTAINSVYGLTAATFDNPFRDIRNKDNIVAKRGALFMVDLKHEVQKRGFTVAHIKTDSIKIPNATPEIIQFVMDFGKRYGYTFEHEATYERMCLVNNAVYIARYKDGKHAGEWTATGTQFQIPYVFKTLFSKESIVFEDMCETKSVTSALYLDLNEGLPNVVEMEMVSVLRRKLSVNPGAKITKSEASLLERYSEVSDDDLNARISTGHNYMFIGKVGSFCPIKPGCGGGDLVRETSGGYSSATGAKGYRWLESEEVKLKHKMDDIDLNYYRKLVDEAAAEISKYGDVDWFASGAPGPIPVKLDVHPWFNDSDNSNCPFDVR